MMPSVPQSPGAAESAVSSGRAAAARRLYAVATVLLMAVLPGGMVFANKAAAAVVTLAAVAAVLAMTLEVGPRKTAKAVASLARGPLFFFSVAFTLWSLSSILWSSAPRQSLIEFGGTLLTTCAAVTLLPTLRHRAPAWALPLLLIVTIAAMVTIWFEMLLGLPLSHFLGTYRGSADLNRPTITILLLFWPMFGWLRFARRDGLAAAMVGLMALTVALSHSGTALVALLVSAPLYACALVAPRTALVGLGAVTLTALALAPWTGTLVKSVTPVSFYQNLHRIPGHGFSATERVQIWQSFGAVVQQRPLLGGGFGSSRWTRSEPVAAKIAPQLQDDLKFIHPHNTGLQIWVELGVVGAILAGAVVVCVLRLYRVRDALFASHFALLATVVFIAEVSHGAWQAWWFASIGAAFLVSGLDLAVPRPRRGGGGREYDEPRGRRSTALPSTASPPARRSARTDEGGPDRRYRQSSADLTLRTCRPRYIPVFRSM